MPILSEAASAGRDWLYLAAMLSGAALAVPSFGLSRRTSRVMRRSRLWSICFALLAGASAAAAFSFMFFGGIPFAEVDMFRVSSIIMLLSALSLRFPRTIGFPVIVASGAALSFFAAIFLSLLPCAAEDPLGLLRIDAAGRAEVRFQGAGTSFLAIPSSGPSSFLSLEAFEVEFNRTFPFVGGSLRRTLFSVRSGDSAVLHGSLIPLSWADFFRTSKVSGIRCTALPGEIDPLSLYPGTRAILYVSENRIVSRIIP